MITNILYPLLFSCIPIFTFFSSNIKEIDKKSILFIFLIDIISVLGLWSILTYVVKLEGNISSGILFYLIIWFYTPWYKLNRFKSRYAYQYIIKYIIYAAITCAIVYISILPVILTIIFSLIILLNIIYIISNNSKIDSDLVKEDIVNISVNDSDKPDIYHIILDGYLGKEVLSNITNYDNNEFYSQLKALGFTVYNNIYSNYNYTAYSIPSIFNMNYFNNYMQEEELNSEMYKQNKLQYGYFRIIHSKTVLSLKNIGYKIAVSGETMFTDELQSYCKNIIDIKSQQTYDINVNATFSTFLQTTIISNLFMSSKKPNKNHALYLRNLFDKLKNLKYSFSPIYSIFHILAPHPPFCFQSDGSINEKFSSMVEYPAYDKDGLEAYKNHMLYINKLTIDALSNLIKNIKEKNRKAIILVHGDHGLMMNNPDKPTYNTLLAVYKYNFNDDKDIFKDNITLVNIMPYLFNYIFNTNISTHKNEFYFCDLNDGKYINNDVTNIINKFMN